MGFLLAGVNGRLLFFFLLGDSHRVPTEKARHFFRGGQLLYLVAFGLCALPGPEGPGIKHAISVTVMDLASLLHRLYNVVLHPGHYFKHTFKGGTLTLEQHNGASKLSFRRNHLWKFSNKLHSPHTDQAFGRFLSG